MADFTEAPCRTVRARQLQVAKCASLWLVAASLAAFSGSAEAAPPGGAKKTKSQAPPAAAAPKVEESSSEEWSASNESEKGRARDPELGEAPTTAEGAKDPDQRPSPLTPRPEEMPSRSTSEPPDYSGLLAELVALRARVSALSAALYESKLRIRLDVDGEDVRIAALTVTVDGGVVYTSPKNFVSADGTVVYEHAVAPGRHVIGVEVERLDPRAKTYRTWQATRFAVDVPDKKMLSAQVELEDDSSFRDPTNGRYRLKSSMRVEVVEP